MLNGMKGASPRQGLLRAIGRVSGLFLLIIAVVFTGVLDRLSGADGIPRALFLQSAAVYWTLCCLALGLVTAWRTRLPQLAMAIVSLLFSLGLFELAARQLELPAGFLHWNGVASRTHHHLYAPSRKMYAGIYLDEPVFVETNRDGIRTPYERETFRAFATRIAILGDSFTFGFGVAQEDSMPTRLEQFLRQETHDDDLAVLNAGVVSYSPLLEKLLFDDIVRHYDPQLVLLVLDPTDIGDDYTYGQEAVEEQGRTVFPRAGPECGEDEVAHYYGATIEVLAPMLKPLEPPLRYPLQVIGPRLGIPVGKNCAYDYYDFQLEIGGVVETNRFFHYRHPLSTTRPHFDASLAHIEAIARAVRGAGAEFLLVISPRFHHWNAAESPENWEHQDYALDEPYQFEYFRYFEQASSRVPFRVFDLLPSFQATEEFPLVFEDDPHWNPRGNVFAARSLARYLLDQGLVEEKP